MARAKYKKWLEPDSLVKLEAWARDGLTDQQIAHNIGINPKTLYDWQHKYQPIRKALKRGKEVVDFEVENALLKRALGYEYEEVKQIIEKDETGRDRKRIEKTVRQIAPDVTAQIFWLKNRKPDDWRNKTTKDREMELLQIEKMGAEIERLQAETERLKAQLEPSIKSERMMLDYIDRLEGALQDEEI